MALRIRCAEALTALDFPGYALGGFSVGEATQHMVTALEPSADALPTDKPRYLMGVGTPLDLVLPSCAASICSIAFCPPAMAAMAMRSRMRGNSRFAMRATSEIPRRWSPIAPVQRVGYCEAESILSISMGWNMG